MKIDKIKHIVVGFIFGAATYASQKWGWGLVLSSVIFVSKELYDEKKPNPTGFDTLDLFCDYLGFAGGFGSAGFIHGLIKMFI